MEDQFMTNDDAHETASTGEALEGEPLEDLEPETDDADGVQGGWRPRGEEEEELQM
jgi:hypothetical protein